MKDLNKPFWASKKFISAVGCTLSALALIFAAPQMTGDVLLVLAAGVMGAWTFAVGGQAGADVAGSLPSKRPEFERPQVGGR